MFVLTNDDGIEAPGLAALAQAAEPFGRAVVVAPDRHLSGCSHQVTTSEPLHLIEQARDRYSLDGSPVDCARIALSHVALETEWLLSGINEGGNLGADIFISGTVAAAREACLLGRPAIAISQYVRARPVDWQQAARWTQEVLKLLLERPLPRGSFWNVNLPQPAEPGAQLPEYVFCSVDPHPLPVNYVLSEGKLHYRARYHDRLKASNHDVDVCFSGRIAISQIHLHPVNTSASQRD